MTIEQRINEYLSTKYRIPIRRLGLMGIKNYEWSGSPFSKILEEKVIDGFITLGDDVFYEIEINKTIENMINRTDDAECLTSRSEYIRECKKWFMGIK